MLRSRFFVNFVLMIVFSMLQPVMASAQFRNDSIPNTISVSGEAQVNVVSDKALITLGVETTAATVVDAKRANDAIAGRLLEIAKDFKIDPKDVQTDYVSIEPDYMDGNRRMMQPVRYMVRKSLVVTLRDVSRFDAFLGAAVDGGANVVLGVQFLTSDLRKYRDQARTLAIKAARDKAELLADALGQKIGKAVNIEEVPTIPINYYGTGWHDRTFGMTQNSQVNVGNAASDEGAGDTTAPGQTQVRANVQVVFQLE